MSKARKQQFMASRYLIQKGDKTPVDPFAEYFVLRVDNFGKDPLWAQSCREAVRCLVKELRMHNHLPDLANGIEHWINCRNHGRLEKIEDLSTIEDGIPCHVHWMNDCREVVITRGIFHTRDKDGEGNFRLWFYCQGSQVIIYEDVIQLLAVEKYND